MRRTRDLHQTDLFDAWAFLGEKRRRLLELSWAGLFHEHLLSQLPVSQFAEHFSSAMGRPTKDLYVACGVLILQQLHDTTDAQTVDALAFNIMWHYALDIRDQEDAYICEKTLRNYRRLVIERGLDELLFQCLTGRLINAFKVDTARQRLDSTAIRSAMRSLTRMGTVVETIAKFLRELARVHPQLHTQVQPQITQRYLDRESNGCFANTAPSESNRRLPEAGGDLLQLALMFRDTDAADLASFQILERVLREQFEVLPSDNGDSKASLRVKEPKEIPCDNVRNPADPDSSYNKHQGQGYMAQIMETYQQDDDDATPSTQPDLITHVSVHKMTVQDTRRLTPAVDDVEQRGVQPEQLLADSHYGSNDHMQNMADRNIELVSPAMPPKGSKQDRLTLEQFELDGRGLIVRCPAGHQPLTATHGEKKVQARFDDATCQSCPLLTSCPVRTSLMRGSSARWQYTHQRVAMRERRLADQSKAFKQVYRWRAGIEATMSRLKHQMRLAHMRVRGAAAVTYRVMLRALGLNIHRCAMWQSAA